MESEIRCQHIKSIEYKTRKVPTILYEKISR